MERSMKLPFEASYICVPLITTAYAGWLTPQARIAIQQRTFSEKENLVLSSKQRYKAREKNVASKVHALEFQAN